LSVFFVLQSELLRSIRGVVVYGIMCKHTTNTTTPRHLRWCACKTIVPLRVEYCRVRSAGGKGAKKIPSQLGRVSIIDARLEGVNVKLESTLQVTGLVLVDDVVLSQLVQHSGYLGKQSLSGRLLGGVAQGLHGIASGLVIQTVVSTLGHSLTDSLLRRLMVCHNRFSFFYFLLFRFLVKGAIFLEPSGRVQSPVNTLSPLAKFCTFSALVTAVAAFG